LLEDGLAIERELYRNVPSFDDLKEYVLAELRAARMKAVHEKER
jgi:hypothetical protein